MGLVRARRECLEAWSVVVGVIAESCPADSFNYPIISSFFLHLSTLLTARVGPCLSGMEEPLRCVFVRSYTTVSIFLAFILAPVRYAVFRHAADPRDALFHRHCVCPLHRPTQSLHEHSGSVGHARLRGRMRQDGL